LKRAPSRILKRPFCIRCNILK